ncbi:hypothetical protein ACFH04_39195 [Streptomyces noboritoensis]|uniref:Uncharacterized protein n=1 Tax=Streptomyces noboritoensis TaxID=67337 RepID=A0ABV6TYY9_9ACTN
MGQIPTMPPARGSEVPAVFGTGEGGGSGVLIAEGTAETDRTVRLGRHRAGA